jgi:hypothetical protein
MRRPYLPVRALALLLLPFLSAVPGCRQTGPAVEFVEGVISLDGEPVADATVGFSPAGGSGPTAFGKTDDKGVFHLTTVQGGRPQGGAPVGEYIVTVKKWRNRLAELGPRPDPSDAAFAAWSRREQELLAMPPDYIVPLDYGEKRTSGLKATVKPGRNVGPEYRFELKGDFKGG